MTAAQWAWRGDTGWVVYEAKMNLHVENEYLEGVKRISVDGERFIDVSLPVRYRLNLFLCCEQKDCDFECFDEEKRCRLIFL